MKLNHLLSSNWQYNLKKLANIVKISFLLSVIMTLSSFAHTSIYSQEKISVNVENTEIINILDNIESTTDLRFFYDNDIYDFKKKITLSIDEVTIAKAISLIFENNIDFRLKQNVVILEKAKLLEKSNVVDTEQSEIEQRIITGLVTDNLGSPLPGAAVVEVGTNNGTTSDFDGNFSIALENDEASLQISFIGFVSQTVIVGESNSISIQLSPDESSLDEIIVTGYGTTRKGDITSSISVLDLDGVGEKAITDVGQMLAGRSAGVRVVQGSGQPGAAPTIFIRGLSSLSGNTQPLYVIDGVVSYSLGALDPNNIEDITVLKDASAAGIYGAAGASNGVVLVTTKKGRKGEYKVSVNSYAGFSSVIKTIPVLDNAGTVDYFNDLNGSGSSIPASELAVDNNWQDLIYREAAPVTGVNAAISGGGENGSFFVGLGYLDQDGIVVSSGNKRYSLSINLDQTINEWLSFGSHFNYTRSNIKTIPDNMAARFGGAIQAALVTPRFQPIFNDDGTYSTQARTQGGLNNPLGYIYGNDNINVINNIVTDVNFTAKINSDLSFKTQMGVVILNNHYSSFKDPRLTSEAKGVKGEGSLNTGEAVRFIFDNTLNYDKTFDKHQLGVIIGSSTSEEKIHTSLQTKRNFANANIRTLNSASETIVNSASKSAWSLQSYFARANYSFDDKYLITASFRTDGSSRLPENNRWESFKTISAGWKIFKEDFMSDVDFISDLKLRVGYGETGNLPAGTNSYAYKLLFNEYAIDTFTTGPGVWLGLSSGNNNLEWETSDQFNVGIDFSTFDNRLYFSADYYSKKTNNMIYPLSLPWHTGFFDQIVNLDGQIENTGFEFAINANLIEKDDFSWSTAFNMSFNDNVVTNIPDTAIITDGWLQNLGGNVTITKNDLPIGSFWGKISEGVDPQTGDLIFADNGKFQFMGSPLPDFTYGFVNEINYKNWDLNIVIDGVSGNEVYNTGRQELEEMRLLHNQSADIVNRWRKPGDITNIPRATILDQNGNSKISSRFVEDGSYLRVRDISLSYDFDENVIKGLNINGLRLYANLKNWFTITDYTGYTPEINRGGASATVQGVDYGTYPQPKTFNVGMNIEF